MDRSIGLLGIGLVFGGLAGFVVAAGNGISLRGHDHDHAGGMSHAAHGGDAHHHDILNLSKDGAGPTVIASVTADPQSGWNLYIETTNFRFSPENASRPHIQGEGHAHIYINGEKVARHYGPWFHIDTLSAGQNTIEVTLNSNDHRLLALDGAPLRARVNVVNE